MSKFNTIITVHDIIPILAWRGHIKNFNYPHKPILFEYSINSLKNATHIIAVSKNTKKDLIEHCGFKKKILALFIMGVVVHLSHYQKFKKKTFEIISLNFQKIVF